MPVFTVLWEADGEAVVEAASEEVAQKMVSDGLHNWTGDIDWQDNITNGTSVEVE